MIQSPNENNGALQYSNRTRTEAVEVIRRVNAKMYLFYSVLLRHI